MPSQGVQSVECIGVWVRGVADSPVAPNLQPECKTLNPSTLGPGHHAADAQTRNSGADGPTSTLPKRADLRLACDTSSAFVGVLVQEKGSLGFIGFYRVSSFS